MAAQGFFTRMAPYRWALEPSLGAVIALAWGSAALAFGSPSSLFVVWFFAIAVALSRLVPIAALVVSAVGIVGAMAVATGDPAGDPATLALLFVSGCLVTWGVGLAGKPAVRFVALGLGLLLSGLITCMLLLSVYVPGQNGLDGMLRFFALLGFRLTEGFLATAVLVGGWVGALVLRARADRRPATDSVDDLTAETWLMSPTSSAWLTGPALFEGRKGFRPLSRRTLAIDLGIAGAFGLVGILFDPRSSLLSLAVLIGLTAALAVRRLSPALALTVAWVTALIQMLGGLPVLGTDVAILAVLYATAAYADRFVRWAGLVSVGVGALLAAGYLSIVLRGVTSLDATMTQADIADIVWSLVAIFIASLAVLGLSWTLGLLMRTWHTARDGRLSQSKAVEEQRLAQRSVVVEQERNRIARDMHDVVAHSLAVVIAQADGARYARAQNPEAVDLALSTISTTARDALGDVRILLTRLRQDDAAGPQPVLADLDRLVAQMRSTGLDIEWTTTGTPTTLGSGAQLAVYRIVQEALTNALRHGDAGRAVYLSLAWTDGWVAVTIDNAVSTTPLTDQSDQAGEIGHGLPGMRERALLAGGSLAAESIGGRFIVAARLPAITTNALVRPAAASLMGEQP
ncbi:histidine kinase [Cryobacterium sp. SO2]|uniref:sensor histidine kinase n=1 Tax=Cryobacterium sp. SO2 TaxID=1897060 RepID=UPI00223CFDB5|nr:histidine kinase [Cryobacterium sp. SO2]WEO79095.1 histidine kinase [Cryobacterium sp. SO2]